MVIFKLNIVLKQIHCKQQVAKGDIMKITMEQIQEYFDILSPCMDNYLYLYDFQYDECCISANSMERFAVPATHFDHAQEKHALFIHPDDYKLLMKALYDIVENGCTFHDLEYRWIDKEGKIVWINCRGHILKENGKPRFLLGCLNEIGKMQKADNISGLRREIALLQELTEDKLMKKNGFVIRAGIDDFREIIENHGIEYGDMILQRTAECISSVISSDQKVYRIVEDEFVIADFSGGTLEDARRICKAINQALACFIQDNQYEVFYTLSEGILVLNQVENQSYINLMKLSEFALNRAKENGKKQVYIYSEEDYNNFIYKRKLIQIMRQAVYNNFEGFETYYQPIISIKDKQLNCAEALLRFYNKECGRISPIEFIPILEESGLIIPVGVWVMEQAIKSCGILQEYIPDFRISVNLSYIQVQKSNILEAILKLIEKYHIKPGSLMVELTESGFLEDCPCFEDFCKGLKEQGILLALDDFGSGYSNFRYLSSLNPNILKVDRTFMTKAIQNKQEYTLLKYMIEMSHSINLKMCIEGVETIEELEKISKIEPDFIQGYYYGRPCPFDEFLDKFILKK